jgi:hypothetical protein
MSPVAEELIGPAQTDRHVGDQARSMRSHWNRVASHFWGPRSASPRTIRSNSGSFVTQFSRLKVGTCHRGTIGTLCLSLVVATTIVATYVQPGVASLSGSSHLAHTSTLAGAPASLRAEVRKDLARDTSKVGQLSAMYSTNGAELYGSNLKLSVALGSIRRGTSSQDVASSLALSANGGTYGKDGLVESFKTRGFEIEQTFHVAKRLTGSRPLVIDVPVSGLVANSDGRAVELRNAAGQVRAIYSGLRVTDAKGKRIRATMRAL